MADTQRESELRRVQKTWDALARGSDVLGIIYGYPRKPNQSLESFFATGEREIGRTLRNARHRRLPRRREAALDFGCGVGRLTQAMARRFEHAIGVDISAAMIETARALNRHGDRCEYVLNEDASLAAFGDASFDFVYSNVVLQHMPPDLGRLYVAEFARVLRPGGLLVFQVPHDRAPLRRLTRRAVVAEIQPAVDRLHVPADAPALIRARVRNRSGRPWPGVPAPRGISLGNHWLSEGGRMLVLDDGRVALGRDLGPGEQTELELEVTAPRDPGRYTLEIDLVQEGVAWFAQRRKLSRRRTESARIAVEVGEIGCDYEPADASPARHPDPSVEHEPRAEMEMHAIRRETVLATLEAAGARVLRVVDDHAAGLGWLSLRYTATKDA